VLAALAMAPGQSVALPALINRVWGDRPPREAAHSLYTHISALRRALQESDNGAGSVTLQRLKGAYLLEIDPDRVDLYRARRYAAAARALLENPDRRRGIAVELLRRASQLWRGEPLTGLHGDWASRVRQGLDHERLAMLMERFRLELELGGHASAVGPLGALLADYPLAEPLVCLQMLALYRCGRHADALEVYTRTRRRLINDLSAEPGAELRELHKQILRRDPTLDLARGRPGPVAGAGGVVAGAGGVVGGAGGVVGGAGGVVGAPHPGSPAGSGEPTGDADREGPGADRGTYPERPAEPATASTTMDSAGPTPAPAVPTPAGQLRAGTGQAGTALTGRGGGVLVSPAQLPADLNGFVGRAEELSWIAADHQPDAAPPTARIYTVDGMAGVGKTTFAIHAAHQLAPEFPDGQLFIDLHGFTAELPPLPPASALAQLLRSLGHSRGNVPTALSERAALYRSLTAQRRLLIVLDNAASDEQVWPLIPGTARCLVVITSRRRLTGLDHAQPLSLDVLPEPDAAAVFIRAAGEDRVAGEPQLIAAVVERCERLPLALRLAGARLRARPTWTLGHLLRRLEEPRQRILELALGRRSLMASFDLSYQRLSAEEQRVVRLLGIHPGIDVDARTVAVLTGFAESRAEGLLEQLVDAHLVQSPAPGRYLMHGLVRSYAAALADRHGPQADPPQRPAPVGL
jgi:DNA-binding SARP family transcriptional activator